jgi:hypothetical protein
MAGIATASDCPSPIASANPINPETGRDVCRIALIHTDCFHTIVHASQIPTKTALNPKVVQDLPVSVTQALGFAAPTYWADRRRPTAIPPTIPAILS